ncbi:hypothetical protein ACLOAV_007677 [Pseudogymnoascus australis]
MADYPNPFAPAPSTPLAPTGMADYPDPFAPAPVGCPTLANTNVAVCPTNSSVYHTVDGTFFKIQCGYHHGTTAVQITTAPSLQKCIDKCSQENSCNSVNYIPSSLGCTLISSTGATTVSEASAGQDYAYKISLPNWLARDESLQMAKATPPYLAKPSESTAANVTEQHTSRHTSRPTSKPHSKIAWTLAPLTSPATASTTTSDPGPVKTPTTMANPPSNVESSSQGCSGRTSCSPPCIPPKPLGPFGPLKPDLSCGNQGLQYAIYSNTRPDGSNNLAIVAGYPTFGPAKFKTDRLQYSGTTPRIRFGSSTPIHGNAPADPGLTTVKHRAYIFTQQSGTYTFRFPFVDDISLLGVGPAAYSGYTRSNANIVQLQTGSDSRHVHSCV